MKLLAVSISILFAAAASARGEPPGSHENPPPIVVLSPPPVAPLLPSPGKPWFSVVTRDEGTYYKVYATVQNANPEDVRVAIHGRALMLSVLPKRLGEKSTVKSVPLPDAAIAKIATVKQKDHVIVITVPKKK